MGGWLSDSAWQKRLFRYGLAAIACVIGILGFLLSGMGRMSAVSWSAPFELRNGNDKGSFEKTADFLLKKLPRAHAWAVGKFDRPLLIEGWVFELSDFEPAVKNQKRPETNMLGMRGWVLSPDDFTHLTNTIRKSNIDMIALQSSPTSTGIPLTLKAFANTNSTEKQSASSQVEYEYLFCELKPILNFDYLKIEGTIWGVEPWHGPIRDYTFTGLAGLHSSLGKGEALLLDTNERLKGEKNCWFIFVWKKL